MTLSDTYKFYITIDGLEQEFFPVNDAVSWSKERYEDECFFRQTLNTELCIEGDLFKTLWELSKQDCICHHWDMRIERQCCDDVFNTYWHGTINYVDGTWNPEDCKLEVSPRTVDEYSCVLSTWDIERNFLDIQERVTISNLFGDIDCERIYLGRRPLFDFSQVQLEGQSLYSAAYIDANGFSGNDWSITDIEMERVGQEYDVYYTRCRECTTQVPPNPSLWTFDGTRYCRPSETDLSLNSGPLWYSRVEVTFPVATNGVVFSYQDRSKITLDNGITLQKFLEFYLSDCFGCIVSNFFNINPDGTNPDTVEYRSSSEFHNIIVFQTFEVIGELEDNAIGGQVDQLLGIKAFKDFWEELRDLLSLCMVYDSDTDCLRIEHCSYFDNQGGPILDLTGVYKSCLVGKSKFTVDKIKLPKSETWEYDFGLVTNFTRQTIEYDPLCSNDDEDLNDEEYIFKCFSNDVSYIYRNEEFATDENAANRITLVATDGNVILEAGGVVNYPFSMDRIVRRYHLRKRPQCVGMIDGRSIEFLSTIPVRKHETLQVPISCQWLDQIDPASTRVKTHLGITTIDSMSWDEPNGFVNLELYF